MHASGGGGPAPARSADEALVARLLAVIGGDAPMAEALELLAPDVVSHMDQFTVRGTDVWFDWLAFIRSRATGDLRVAVDRIVTHPDGTISAFGWLTVPGASLSLRQENHARYRVEGGRVREVWTTRENYEIIFGAKVRRRFSWLLVLLQMAIWRRLPWRTRTFIP
jgi:hypothetical protein